MPDGSRGDEWPSSPPALDHKNRAVPDSVCERGVL